MDILSECQDCGTNLGTLNVCPRCGRDAGTGSNPPAEVDAYRELFERSADPILIIEGDQFIDCNEATVKILGYTSREELLQTHPSELSPETQPDGRSSFDKANENLAIAFEKGSHRFEWDHQRADGEVFPVEVLLTAVQEPGRRVLHVVWRDISERKKLEEQLRHSQKMEAIGKLAGGIAHDFNNLLVVIQGYSELLSERFDRESQDGQDLGHITEAAERAATLVRQLLAFGRKQQIQPEVLDVNEVLSELQQLVRPLLGDDVVFALNLWPTPMYVKADIGQLEQVLLNLAANARDAMPDGGTLTIESRPEADDENEDKMTVTKNWVVIRVSDDGTGMASETLDRAFDPFYTTKEVGAGTGLGLATVYGIVSRSGGSVDLASEPGHGTSVTIRLPITDEAPREAPVSATLPVATGGTETILVVEDEPAVSRLVVNTLRKRGYQVLVAADGREAETIYRRNSESIDLILSDVMMPVMGGPQLVAELSKSGFNPLVLFMSGYTDDALKQLKDLNISVDLVEKPFKPTEIANRVRQVLQRVDVTE